MRTFFDTLHIFFIPHEKNNYRAKALHIDFLTFCLILVFALSFGLRLFTSHAGQVLGFATDITVDKLLQKTNTAREENNLPSLAYSDKLAAAAAKKASDMFAKNYWSHYGPDGATPWDFILSSGYRYEYAGENLAKNFLFSQGVIDAWMRSSSHRDNILRKEYAEVGYAVVNGILNGEETTIVVEMFGRPLATPIAKQIEIRPNVVEAGSSIIESTPIIQQQKQAILAQESSPQKNTVGQFSFLKILS